MHRFAPSRHLARAVAATLACLACASVVPAAAQEPAPPSDPRAESPSRPPKRVFALVERAGHYEVLRREVSDFAELGELRAAAEARGRVVSIERDEQFRPAAVATDPRRSEQWGMGATSFETAWGASRGGGVDVAVIDSGVDASHPDLAGSVHAGCDLVSRDAGDAACAGDADTDPYWHGTHVAGIIAARAGNGLGIAGAAPRVSILPVRVFNQFGFGATTSTVSEAVIWAADHGAEVINMSIEGPQSVALAAAVSYASVTKGALVVAAVGNDGTPALRYPAALEGVIGAGAVDPSLAHASFSNVNASVDLVAPGVDVLSTFSLTSGYVVATGTSQAAPWVSAAAILRSAHPTITNARVREALEASADDLGALGRDDTHGYGLVDPSGALAYARTKWYPQAAPPTATGGAVSGTGAGGYIVVSHDGHVRAYGSARHHGDLARRPPASPVVAAAALPDGTGYWLATAEGFVYRFGRAKYLGSMAGNRLNAPVVAMAATSDGRGYWLLAADGGIFTFGNARFFGSTGGQRLNAPVVDLAPAAGGRGYWLLGRDGGVFTFGDARFFGSTGALKLNAPVVSMAASSSGGGYWLVADDGGIFAFGVPFLGSLPGLAGATLVPAERVRAVRDGRGYYVLSADGSVRAFGRTGLDAVEAPLFGVDLAVVGQ